MLGLVDQIGIKDECNSDATLLEKGRKDGTAGHQRLDVARASFSYRRDSATERDSGRSS